MKNMQPIEKCRSDPVTKTSAVAEWIIKPWLLLYRSKFLKIEILLFLYMFARFFYLPLYEQYYFFRFGSDLLHNTSYVLPNGTASVCLNSSVIDKFAGVDSHKVVEKYSNNLVLYGQLAGRLPSMIVVLIMGPLSDRFGRKPVLIASLIGTVLQAVMALAIVYFTLNPNYFILANFLTGLFGDFTGLVAGAFSYIADVSSHKWRTFRIGVIEGMLAVGGALGQFFSGYWLSINHCNFIPPVLLDLACCLAALLWVIFLLPESLPKKERLEKVAKKPKGVKAAMEGLKMFFGRMPQYSAWKLWTALLMLNLPLFNAEGSLLVTLYFLKVPPFDLNPLLIGAFQAVQSFSRAVSVTLLLVIFSIGLKLSDGLSAFVGIFFQLAANLLMGFAQTSTQAFFIAVVQGVEAVSWAAGRSLMSKLVLVEDQGALFSVVASFQSMASLISSVLWPFVFPLTLQQPNLTSGFIYYIMAMIDILGFPLVIILIVSDVCRRRTDRKQSEKVTEQKKDKKYLQEQDSANVSLLGTSEVPFYLSMEKGSINHARASH